MKRMRKQERLNFLNGEVQRAVRKALEGAYLMGYSSGYAAGVAGNEALPKFTLHDEKESPMNTS